MATKQSIAPDAAQSVQSEALPSRNVLKERLEDVASKVAGSRAILCLASFTMREAAEDNTLIRSEAELAIDAACDILQGVWTDLADDPALLAPAEATEVANG